MDRRELHALLIARGARTDAFDVLGVDLPPLPGETYVLRPLRSGRVGEPDRWATGYHERGIMRDVREFMSEDEACRAFLSMIEADRTVFR